MTQEEVLVMFGLRYDMKKEPNVLFDQVLDRPLVYAVGGVHVQI